MGATGTSGFFTSSRCALFLPPSLLYRIVSAKEVNQVSIIVRVSFMQGQVGFLLVLENRETLVVEHS